MIDGVDIVIFGYNIYGYTHQLTGLMNNMLYTI